MKIIGFKKDEDRFNTLRDHLLDGKTRGEFYRTKDKEIYQIIDMSSTGDLEILTSSQDGEVGEINFTPLLDHLEDIHMVPIYS